MEKPKYTPEASSTELPPYNWERAPFESRENTWAREHTYREIIQFYAEHMHALKEGELVVEVYVKGGVLDNLSSQYDFERDVDIDIIVTQKGARQVPNVFRPGEWILPTPFRGIIDLGIKSEGYPIQKQLEEYAKGKYRNLFEFLDHSG